MRALLAVALVVPVTASAQYRTSLELERMTRYDLLEEYRSLEDQRPGVAGPFVLVGAALGTIAVGALITQLTYKYTNPDGSTFQKSALGWGLIVVGIGAVMLAGGSLWLWRRLANRAATDESLALINARLDVLERPAASPELLALLAAPPGDAKTGELVITVVDALSGSPVAGATIALGDRSLLTDSGGAVSVSGLPPGPVALKLSHAGHKRADEGAVVVAGKRTSVALRLVAENQELPARLTGLVRSRVDGGPIAAKLQVVEANVGAQTDGRGMFGLDLPGGTYTVQITAPGHQAQSKTVAVKSGERVIFNVDLHPL